MNIIKLALEDKWYPNKLKQIYNPPKELYCLRRY